MGGTCRASSVTFAVDPLATTGALGCETNQMHGLEAAATKAGSLPHMLLNQVVAVSYLMKLSIHSVTEQVSKYR